MENPNGVIKFAKDHLSPENYELVVSAGTDPVEGLSNAASLFYGLGTAGKVANATRRTLGETAKAVGKNTLKEAAIEGATEGFSAYVEDSRADVGSAARDGAIMGILMQGVSAAGGGALHGAKKGFKNIHEFHAELKQLNEQLESIGGNYDGMTEAQLRGEMELDPKGLVWERILNDEPVTRSELTDAGLTPEWVYERNGTVALNTPEPDIASSDSANGSPSGLPDFSEPWDGTIPPAEPNGDAKSGEPASNTDTPPTTTTTAFPEMESRRRDILDNSPDGTLTEEQANEYHNSASTSMRNRFDAMGVQVESVPGDGGMTVSATPDGQIVARSPQERGARARQEQNGDARRTLDTIDRFTQEESGHLAMAIAIREDWIRDGKPGDFDIYLQEHLGKEIRDLRDHSGNLSEADATAIAEGFRSSVELYYGKDGPEGGALRGETLTEMLDDLSSRPITAQASILGEFVRQAIQDRSTGRLRSNRGQVTNLDFNFPFHYGSSHAKQQAERILKEACRHFNLTEEDLIGTRRGDPTRVAVAWALWRETSVRMHWIAERLDMRSAANVSQQVRRFDKLPDNELPKQIRTWIKSRFVT